MDMRFSERQAGIESGIFAVLDDKKKELDRRGRKIYNVSIGTPDFEPEKHVMEAVSRAALRPENYKYAISDLPELITAVQTHYSERFGVVLEPSQIMSVYGSQEGIAHIAIPYTDPGDVVLVPDPGYQIFSAGPFLCGAKLVTYPLFERNHFLPELSAIPEEVWQKARFMIVSYPANPIARTAPEAFYEELIAFAKKYSIMIIHDNAYSDIIFDGRIGRSFLSFPGAMEVGAEFYSLSKSYNYTGARLSFFVGNAQMVSHFRKVRSQIDYGIFLPVQYGAIAALTGPQDSLRKNRKEYECRRDALCGGLRSIGWNVPDSEGTMFVWAPLPEGYSDSTAFCLMLMEKTGVICVPGISFGKQGEGYVRFALVLSVAEIKELVRVVDESGILRR